MLFGDAFRGFSRDKVPKLGGSLAYFTIFSLGPMLLVVIFFAGLFLGRQAVEGSLYTQIDQLVGPAAAKQVQQLILMMLVLSQFQALLLTQSRKHMIGLLV